MAVPLKLIDAREPRAFVSFAWPSLFCVPSFVHQLPL
jgi:hypothetical protein